MSKKITELIDMEFGDLRQLIDYCLGNLDDLDSDKLRFVTNKKSELNEYINILEKKRKPTITPNFERELITSDDIERIYKGTIEEKTREIKENEKKLYLLKKQISLRKSELLENQEKLAEDKLKLNRIQFDILKNYKLSWSKAGKNYQNQSQQKSLEKEKGDILEKIKETENNTFEINKDLFKFVNLNNKAIEKHNKLKNEIDNLINKIDCKEYDSEIKLQQKLIDDRLTQKTYEYQKDYPSILAKYKISLTAKIINRLRSELAEANNLKIKAKELNWKLLPKGDNPFGKYAENFQEFFGVKEKDIDYEKINKILSLKPNEIYRGRDEFEGYFVFYFEQKKIAVLDCPLKGNAIYIFDEDWKNLSKLTKSDLLNYHPEKTVRIIHRGDWFDRLKIHLQIN